MQIIRYVNIYLHCEIINSTFKNEKIIDTWCRNSRNYDGK
jgi:hypothetical protein